MKKIIFAAPLLLGLQGAWAADDALRAEFKAMMDASFKTTGIAAKHRIYQLDFQAACSQAKPPSAQVQKAIEAEHVASLDLGSFASFQCGDTPLGRALAQMGQALDLRESAKRTESQSTSYSYVAM